MQKSQAALEFLTTYAWAFIVIVISISALYYFGIFDFDKYLPQKCLFPEQFKCLDFTLKPSSLMFRLVNNIGEDICVKSVEATNDANPPLACTFNSALQTQGSCSAGEFEWLHSAEKDFEFTTCTNGAYIPNEKAEVFVKMNYYSLNTPSKPIHLINGKINGRVTT